MRKVIQICFGLALISLGLGLDKISLDVSLKKSPVGPETSPFYLNLDVKGTKTKLALALYTSYSFLASDACNPVFVPYKCTEEKCKTDSSRNVSLITPYFSVNGNYWPVDIVLHNKMGKALWQNYQGQNVILAEQCKIGFNDKTVNGILGFGASYDAVKNFKSDIFSIYLNQNLTSGELIFGIDQDKFIKDSCQKYRSTGDWELPVRAVSIAGNNFNIQVTAIFDLYANSIIIPEKIYDFIITNFENIEILCNDFKFGHLCTYEGDILDLPDIIIITNDNGKITIPPYVYFSSTPNSIQHEFLLIKGSSSISEYGSKLLVPEYTGNTIIFGVNFMRHFYTIFHVSEDTPTVEICLSSHNDSFDLSILFWIVGIGIGFFVLLILCCYLRRLLRKILRRNVEYVPASLED